MRCEEIVLAFMRKANKTHLNSILKVLRKSDTIKSVSMALRMNKKKLHLQNFFPYITTFYSHIVSLSSTLLWRRWFTPAGGTTSQSSQNSSTR